MHANYNCSQSCVCTLGTNGLINCRDDAPSLVDGIRPAVPALGIASRVRTGESKTVCFLFPVLTPGGRSQSCVCTLGTNGLCSPWRPGHLAFAQDMQMYVMYRLPTIIITVHYATIPRFIHTFLFGYVLCCQVHFAN